MIKELDAEFTHEEIETLNKTYIKSLNSQFLSAFKQSLKSHFRKSQLAKTLLTVGLSWIICAITFPFPLLTKILVISICALPYLFYLNFGFKTFFRDPCYPGGFINAHASRASIVISSSILFYNILILAPVLFPDFNLFSVNSFYNAAFMMTSIWFSASSIKVYHMKFRPLIKVGN